MEDSTVTHYRLTPSCAERRIKEYAECTANVFLSKHAKERMAERDIVVGDVYQILRKGQIDGTPERNEKGEHKCKMTLKLRGRRTAGVVVLIIARGRLFVKTVEWEDGR